MNSMSQLLETKNFLWYFIINWFLKPVIGCWPFFLDILVEWWFIYQEVFLSSAPSPCTKTWWSTRLYWKCAWFRWHILAWLHILTCTVHSLYYLLTNWLAYLYGRIQSPRQSVRHYEGRKPVSKKFIAWLKLQVFSPFLKAVTEAKNHD